MTMNVAEYPPPPQKMFAFGRREPPQKHLQFAGRRVIAFDLFAQAFELTRDGGDDRDSLAFDRRDDFRRIEVALKKDLTEKQSRHEYSHKLPEDVAERQQAQKPDRMKWSLELQILFDFGFGRGGVAERVGVRQVAALGPRSRPGSEDDLGQLARPDFFILMGRGGVAPNRLDQLIEPQSRWLIFEMARPLIAAY